MTILAVPVAARTVEAAQSLIQRAASAGADLIEIRTDFLDELSEPKLHALLLETKRLGIPVLVTCRDKAEGGGNDYSADLRTQILVSAVKVGANFIDCELRNYRLPDVRDALRAALKQATACRLIISSHDFEKPCPDAERLYDEIKAIEPAAIPKIVFAAKHINDCFSALDLLHKAGGDSIVIVMGEAGQISRILAGKLGAFLTFASLEADAATAPGQVTLDDMLNLYRFRSQTGKTEVYGVVASPVRHSLSPAIHNACFAKSAMDKVYLPLLVEGGRLEFFEFMQNVLNRPWLNFRGLSVTIPHKENAFEFVEHTGGFIEPLASRIGAINTITIGLNERVSGFNTDCQGAIDAITAGMAITKKELHGVPVAVLGAGGVSRAVIAGLIDAGAHVTIYNRTLSKAQGVAGEFGCCFAAMEEFEKASARLVVNCTSVGMHPVVDQSPIPAAAINKDMVVFDTIYNPTQTKLLSEARAAGAKIIGGIEMFINQALEQFRLFTGKDADPEVMRQIIAEKLLAS